MVKHMKFGQFFKTTPLYKEYIILTLVAKGYTDKEISHILKISERTIQTYISYIVSGLNACNRTNAVVRYMQQHPRWKIE